MSLMQLGSAMMGRRVPFVLLIESNLDTNLRDYSRSARLEGISGAPNTPDV